MTIPDRKRCTARTRPGGRCGRWAITGAVVCDLHGGAAPAVRRRAAVRAAVTDWRVDLPDVDPADQLARLISYTAMRQARMAHLLADVSGEGDDTTTTDREIAALVGVRYGEGGAAVGEWTRELVRIEREERLMLARLCEIALRAGLDERRVRLAEQQVEIVAGVLREIGRRLGLTGADLERYHAVVVDVVSEVRALEGVETPADISWGENDGAGGD